MKPALEGTRLLPDSTKKHAGTGTLAKLILLSGAGLFADGWDISVVNLLLAILAQIHPSLMTPHAKSFAATMLLVGVIIGQVTFGVFADVVGRKKASLATAVLTTGGVVASACVVDHDYMHLPAALALCRFFAGIGIGGEYPLSAALGKEVMAESLNISRAHMLIINMSMFCLGAFCQALFVLILLAANVRMEAIWRVALVMGSVPSVVAFYFRYNMEEPPAAAGNAGLSNYAGNIRALAHTWRPLLGCCLSWAVFNFGSYGLMTIYSAICDDIFGIPEKGRNLLIRNSVFAMVMSGVIIFGNWSCWLIFKYNVPYTFLQAAGFLFFATFSLLTCLCIDIAWLATLFFMLGQYSIAIIGISTYVIPTEALPASVRGSGVGLAAASGKVGGVVGTAVLTELAHTRGVRLVLLISGCVTFAGILSTLALIPRTLRPKEGQ